MLHRMVVAGLLALGTGMAWGDPPARDDRSAALRYSATPVSNDSSLLRGVNFNGVVFPVDPDVLSDIDLTQVDGAMYYELRDDTSDLPWQALYASAQAEEMDNHGDHLLDANLLIGWSSPAGFGVEAGYRHYSLKLINYDQLDRLDIDLSGPYTTVYLHF